MTCGRPNMVRETLPGGYEVITFPHPPDPVKLGWPEGTRFEVPIIRERGEGEWCWIEVEPGFPIRVWVPDNSG